MLGDATKNSTEIKNSFRQPIIVKPNAKVALVGLSAFLMDEVANEQFIIDNTCNQFKIGISDSPQMATIASGIYSPADLLYNTEIAANKTGSLTDVSGIGLHHQFTQQNNFVQITTHSCDPSGSPMFGTWTNRATGTLSYTSTDTGITATAGSGSVVDYAAIVPMVHPVFSATLVNANTADVQVFATAYKKSGTILIGEKYGIGVTSGVYKVLRGGLIGPTDFSPSISAAANDRIQIEMYNGTLSLAVYSSTGTLKGTYVNATGVPTRYYNTADKMRWGVNLTNTASITNATCTRLTNAPVSPKHNLTDSEVSAAIQFVNSSGNVNANLELFLGFGSEGSTIIKYSGNPAILNPRYEMRGLPSYPGILVAIDGLGNFQSYDGAATSKSADNILYVLHDLSTIAGNIVELDVPAPFFLDMNNAHPININELRVRLLPAAGQTGNGTNPVLSFSGKPCITLLIQD